jgi:actin-related protein 5
VRSLNRALSQVQNVFLCGGASLFDGFVDRVQLYVQQELPQGSEIAVWRAAHAMHDAWRGAAKFARDSAFAQHRTTRSDYDEYGAAFFRPHFASNPHRK